MSKTEHIETKEELMAFDSVIIEADAYYHKCAIFSHPDRKIVLARTADIKFREGEFTVVDMVVYIGHGGLNAGEIAVTKKVEKFAALEVVDE